MQTLPATPPVPLSAAGRIAHDVGLAGLLGGSLFGRLALHPSVTEISDPRERGKVVNAAWRRYGTVNSLSLAAVLAGWAGARAGEAGDRRLTPAGRRLARAKDVLVGCVALTGAAGAVQGMRFARAAPHGAVPLRDGDHAAPEATRNQKSAKRSLNALGAASLAGELALVAVHAASTREEARRAASRGRLLPGAGRVLPGAGRA